MIVAFPEHLVMNLAAELYFLIQLITSRGGGEGGIDPSALLAALMDPDDVQYFPTVHNAVFFAVQVMKRQTR